jgi:hypothetical protein
MQLSPHLVALQFLAEDNTHASPRRGFYSPAASSMVLTFLLLLQRRIWREFRWMSGGIGHAHPTLQRDRLKSSRTQGARDGRNRAVKREQKGLGENSWRRKGIRRHQCWVRSPFYSFVSQGGLLSFWDYYNESCPTCWRCQEEKQLRKKQKKEMTR